MRYENILYGDILKTDGLDHYRQLRQLHPRQRVTAVNSRFVPTPTDMVLGYSLGLMARDWRQHYQLHAIKVTPKRKVRSKTVRRRPATPGGDAA